MLAIRRWQDETYESQPIRQSTTILKPTFNRKPEKEKIKKQQIIRREFIEDHEEEEIRPSKKKTEVPKKVKWIPKIPESLLKKETPEVIEEK